MRRGTRTAFGLALAGPAIALLLAGCGGPDAATGADGAAAALEGDAALIASAQAISDAMGGCIKPDDAQVESKVVGLENGAIIMLGCSVGAYSTTHRLFAVHSGDKPELLSFPDYDTEGWFASDQVSMGEIDAGTGVPSARARAMAAAARKASMSGTACASPCANCAGRIAPWVQRRPSL